MNEAQPRPFPKSKPILSDILQFQKTVVSKKP